MEKETRRNTDSERQKAKTEIYRGKVMTQRNTEIQRPGQRLQETEETSKETERDMVDGDRQTLEEVPWWTEIHREVQDGDTKR